MLGSIRSGAQSFGVKVAFGLIILVFVFWGVGNFTEGDTSRVVATVNGQPILFPEFERAYQNAEQQMLMQNRALSREDLKQQQLGRRVLQGLVQQHLLAQEAARAGLDVSPVELRRAVEQIPSFHDDKGKFDQGAYLRVLETQRTNPATFEQQMRDDILREKLLGLMASAAWADPEEARLRHQFLRERRTVDYLAIPAKPFAKDIKVEDSEIQKYYDDNKAVFAIPAKVNVGYIRVGAGNLVNPDSVSKEDAEAWYKANEAKFVDPADKDGKVKPFADVAKEAAQGVAQERGLDKLNDTVDALIEDNILGKDLAASAARFGLKAEESGLMDSQELQAKLGLKPAGAQALLNAGSTPVDTALEAGDYYLIARVITSEPASTKKLDDVRADIATRLAGQKALEAAMKRAAEERAKLADTPLTDEIKKSRGITTAKPMDRGGQVADFVADMALAEDIFAAKPQTWLAKPAAVKDKDGQDVALVVRVNAVLPPEDKEWESIKTIMENGVQYAAAESMMDIFMQQLFKKAEIKLFNQKIVDRVDM